MPVPFEYLKELVAFAHMHGLSHVKCGEIEFTLSPPASIVPPTPQELNNVSASINNKSMNIAPPASSDSSTNLAEEGFTTQDALDSLKNSSIPEEDDFLFWSSGGPLPSELRTATVDADRGAND